MALHLHEGGSLAPPWAGLAALVLALCLTAGAQAAEISAAEYWVDADPGAGNGNLLTVSAAEQVLLNEDLPVTALPPGIHPVGLRFRDDRGLWSLSSVRSFYVLPVPTPGAAVLTAAEYWVDTDPGAGNAQPIAISEGPNPTIAAELPLQALGQGFHTVGFRFRTESGIWSLPSVRSFMVVAPVLPADVQAAEYWVDTDPGAGNGIALPMTPGPNPTVAMELPVQELSVGLHRAGVRFLDSRDVWSLSQVHAFHVESPAAGTAQALVGAEYFINYDPGKGNGAPLDLPADGSWGGLTEEIITGLADLPGGRYWIGLRFRDDRGIWSLTAVDTFRISPILTITSGNPPVLNWTSDGASTFYVYRATSLNGPFALIGTTSANSYTDMEDPPSPARRYYRITQEVSGAFSQFRFPPSPVSGLATKAVIPAAAHK